MGFRKSKDGGPPVKIEREYRKENRHPVEAEATISSGSMTIKAQTVEISAKGFSVRNDVAMELAGENLNVTLSYTVNAGTTYTTKAKCRLSKDSLQRFEVVEPQNAFHSFLEKIWG